MRKKVVLATNNVNKIQEIQEILGESFELIAAHKIDPDIDWDEVGKTFEENAFIKAKTYALSRSSRLT